MLSPNQHDRLSPPTLTPLTLAMDHPLLHHLLTTNRIVTRDDLTGDLQEVDARGVAHAAMERLQVTRLVPHFIKSRLIAFSLLGPATPVAEENARTQSVLAALAQIATNALTLL